MTIDRRLLSYPLAAALALAAAAAGHALGLGTGARYGLAAAMLAVGVAALLVWSERLALVPFRSRASQPLRFENWAELDLGSAEFSHHLTRIDFGLHRGEARSGSPATPAESLLWLPTVSASHSIWLQPKESDLLIGGHSARDRGEYARVLFAKSQLVYVLLAPHQGESLGEVKVPNLARDLADQEIFVWWFEDATELPAADAEAIAASVRYADRATRELWLAAIAHRPEGDPVRAAVTKAIDQS
jgi:hypothetical protein